MSALSEALGQGHELTIDGKTYKIGLIDQNVKLAFERRMFDKAKDAAKAMRDLMDKEEYANHLHKLGDDFQAGEYGLESARGFQAMKTLPGATLMLSILANITEHEAMLLMKSGKEEFGVLFQRIIKDSYHLSDQEVEASANIGPDEEDGKKKVGWPLLNK